MQMEFSERNIFYDEEASSSLNEKTKRFFEDQLKSWKLASDGYGGLPAVQKRTFQFDDFSIEAHFNPGRIISSSAKVDPKSISERPCFLCIKNLPADQKAVKLTKNYILLVNPFPIFDKHFTIPHINHIPQQITGQFENLLSISSILGKDFSIFYNGPKCGASAPDHLHFQAGNFGFMKIDTDFDQLIKNKGKIIFEDNEISISIVTSCMRNFILLKSGNISKLKKEFEKVYNVLSNGKSIEEPMMNIICNYTKEWRVIIFPRTKHRPTYFFDEGDSKILISPAAVDLGGILIFPREEDFLRLNKELIIDIFRQVTFDDKQFKIIEEKIKMDHLKN